MKNPITEYKNKQKEQIIQQLELAYKIAEDLASAAKVIDPNATSYLTNLELVASAGLHTILNHFEAVIDSARRKTKRRVEYAKTKIEKLWKEKKDIGLSLRQAFIEMEHTIRGMLAGFKGNDVGIEMPLGLDEPLKRVTEKMSDVLLKRQEETKKQADLAEKMVGALGSVKTTMEKMTTEADKLKIELTKAKIDAEMEKGLAYEEGVKAGKKEIQIKKE